MAQVSQDTLTEAMARDTWTVQDRDELINVLFTAVDGVRKFQTALAKLEGENPDPRGAAALKIGIARYMLCRFQEALEVLSTATDNRDRRYFQGLCHKRLGNYGAAIEEFERAKDREWEGPQVDFEIVECLALSGEIDRARKDLSRLEGKFAETADFLCARGLIDELSGFGERAAEAYVKARKIDPADAKASFRLAYYYDLHGDEATAMELYKECISRPPVHANALLNMAVLYEDAGDYDRAVICLKRILTCNPFHARAHLFLKDAQASKTMYYDEDQAKRIARRNAVLDIPVTDFELSVRARNCLKKMNIRTLGDLVRTTEADLLSYKNFGETSLKEIKDMLAIKGLRLGQALEEDSELASYEPSPPAEVGDEGVLATPLDDIEFSIRVRRMLQSLNITDLGELAAKSEQELLACKNFGQTSLNEVRRRLAEYGLELRKLG